MKLAKCEKGHFYNSAINQECPLCKKTGQSPQPEVIFRVCMFESIKQQLDTLCSRFGMDASTAINIFVRAVVYQRRIPFNITAPENDDVYQRRIPFDTTSPDRRLTSHLPNPPRNPNEVTFSVCMDESIKQQFDTLCSQFGMNASTAINIFARAVIYQKRIPFNITVPENDVDCQMRIDYDKTAPDNKNPRAGDMRYSFAVHHKSAETNGLQDTSLNDINEDIIATRNEDSISAETNGLQDMSLDDINDVIIEASSEDNK